MKAPHCVITGCALKVNGRFVAGDLFDAGTCFVFHGNVHEGEPAWMGETVYDRVLEPFDWWERRGVFVIPKEYAAMNRAAADYIGAVGRL